MSGKLQPYRQLHDAAIGHDRQSSAIGLTGRQCARIHMKRYLLFARRLHAALPVVRAANAQPFAPLGNRQRTLEHSSTRVAHHKRHLVSFPCKHGP